MNMHPYYNEEGCPIKCCFCGSHSISSKEHRTEQCVEELYCYCGDCGKELGSWHFGHWDLDKAIDIYNLLEKEMNEDQKIMDIHSGEGTSRTDKETIRLYEETKKLADSLGFTLRPTINTHDKIVLQHKIHREGKYESTRLESIHAFLVGWRECRKFLKR